PSGYAVFPRFVRLEAVGHHGLASSSGKYVVPQPDNTPCRDIELKVLHIAFCLHDEQFALSLCYELDHLARHLGGYIDHECLNRLAFHAIDFLDDDLWLTNLKLISFAAHGFNQYGQVEDTPAIHQIRIRRIGLDYLKGKV